MRAEYENVLDDHLGKIHFTYVNTWDELLPAHWHEHLEIIYVLGGEITASINDVSYELKKGDIFLVNSNDIHYTYTHEDARYYLLQIPPVHLERISAKWKGLKFQEFIRSKSADACVQGEQLENVQGKGLVEMRENRKSTNRADDLYEVMHGICPGTLWGKNFPCRCCRAFVHYTRAFLSSFSQIYRTDLPGLCKSDPHGAFPHRSSGDR